MIKPIFYCTWKSKSSYLFISINSNYL